VLGKNGTGNNSTNGKVGKTSTFSILGFRFGSLRWGFEFEKRAASCAYFSICATITCAIINMPFLPKIVNMATYLYVAFYEEVYISV